MIGSTLADKLDSIRSGQYSPGDFIIADAKDGDMAFGVTAPGPNGLGGFWPRQHYLDAMASMAQSGLIDVLLMSASSCEIFHSQGLLDDSSVVPAVRMNDTTDIWMARGSSYRQSPSQAFSTVDIEAVHHLCSLGLYSMTFSNDVEADRNSLLAYGDFRQAVRPYGFRHFLEVFNPAFDIRIAEADLGHYINDMIIKAVAGLTSADAPEFLKIQFNGARAMEELCQYDPDRLVAGILGGASGTTRDTFELLAQAEAAGARVALFGRKINLSEAPLKLVALMREVIEKPLAPEQAVKDYHHYLKAHNITAQRSLEDDLKISDPVLKS